MCDTAVVTARDRHSVAQSRLLKRPALVPILLALAAFLPGISRAQDAPVPQPLPPVTVIAPDTAKNRTKRQRRHADDQTKGSEIRNQNRARIQRGDADNSTTLQTIVATARRRDEDPQHVPISTTVVKDAGTTIAPSASNADLTRSVPNFYFIDGGGLFGNSMSIRGVGAISPLSSDDTSVVIYNDEMPLSVYSIAPNLFDTQRVEVLRGPQGTLFGRNTQAGAVNIISNRPTFDRAYSLTGEVGTNGYGLGQIIANGPIIPDKLAGRLALRWNGFGGDIPNIAAGGKDGGLDIGAARGSFLFTPDDQTEALLTFNYGREQSHSPRFLLPDTPDFPVSATDPRTSVDGESQSVNLRIKHEFDWFILNSQTSYQHGLQTNVFDPTDALVFGRMPSRGGSGIPSWQIPGADVTRLSIGEDSFVQEVRASSLPQEPVSWTVGTNYFRSETSAGRDSHAQTPTFLTINGIQDNHFLVNSYAAFGEVTVPLSERLKATVGLRGTHEDKDAHFRFNGNGLPGVSAGYAQDGSFSDDFLTGRTALSYDWTPDVMTYASIGRGYVTGGFAAYSVNSANSKPENPFPASKSWTSETGFKSRLVDDRLSLNGSIFFNDVTNGHLVLFDPSQAIYTTVALDYQSYGGELELRAKVTPDFEMFGGIGYTHAELVNIPANSFTGARSGNKVPNVPAVSANIGAEYRWSGRMLGLPGDFTGRVTYQYVDARAADVKNSFDLKAYGILNTKLTWQKNNVSVYAFANNLLDERYEAWGQAFGPIQTVRVGQGRVLGVGTSFQF